MDQGPGPERWPFTLEKRYLDVVTRDGTILVVHLAWMRLLGVRVARVTADLFRPGTLRQGGGAKATRVEGGGRRLACGPAVLRDNVLAFETPGLSGELHFAPRHAPAQLGNPLLRAGKRRLEWTVEVPDADVEGTLWWPGGSTGLAGRGYLDRVWTDLLPWHFPIRELRWGRIAAGEHASTWVRATTRGGEAAAGWADGVMAPPEECSGALGPGRLVLEGAVADLEDLQLGALRPLLRWIVRDPQEWKWVCPAEFRGANGVAVHERVTWQ